MSSLGNLYYTMGIRFDESTLTAVNKRLENAGATIKVTPELLKPITDILPKWVNIDINPNQVEQTKLDNAIAGKVMHAEILPLADKLKTAVIDTLKDLQIPLNGLTVPPDKIKDAVANALASANFTSIGDKAGEELSKAIKVKVEGQKYDATITAKTDKLTDTVTKALDKVFEKEKKVKLDRSDIKAFRDELKNKIGEAIKVTPTLNVTQEVLNQAVQGKVMRVEIVPLVSKLRDAIKNAFNGTKPPEIEVGVQEAKLRTLINNVLLKQGYMVNIGTVTGLEKSITTQLKGRVYNVRIRANASEIANSVQASLMQVQSRSFGLQVSKDILRQSIDTALMGKPFNIQIAVMQDQARRAVQNALNNARMVGKDNALAFQRLQTGELRAAQAELARLKAEHMGAASAAKAHASASINLGGALGSNIKIAGELGAAMASLYSVHAAKQFLSQVIEIGGELEHQKIALETIYGSGSKMESLYGQIKSLARQSPFGVMELTKNVKQLSAYGVAYNEVYDTAKRLADISAATSVDIQRLILAFGKTKNRTFLDGLEAKQFAYANIPIYDMLSKKLTELEGKFVSVKDVMGRIKKREIGFDMVKEILWDMTDEGGKFYNMQEKLAGSVKTSWKLVRDNIELMFGEIAESGVGEALKNIGQTLQEVTRSWKALGTIIAAGGGAFAIYKLAILATNVMMGRANAANLAQIHSQAALNTSLAQTAIMYRGLTSEESKQIALKKALDKVNSKNLLLNQSLTTSEIKLLVAQKALTKDTAARLIAMGKITPLQARYLVQQNLITQADLRAAVAARKHGASINLLGKEVTVASFRFRMLGTSIVSSLKSAGAFIFNWTNAAFAAIAGIAYLIQHNMREDEIAEDFTKTWKQKGEDMAKELESSLSKPFENLSAPQATELINEYKNLIKDFATLPDDVIQRAIYDKDGNIRNTADQIKYLREELEALKETAKSMSQDMGTIIGSTGDGWFKEDVITNLKDYSDVYNKANSIYLKFVNEHKDTARAMVDAASQADTAFALEIANAKNLTEQFTILMRQRANFPDAWKAAEDAGGKWATKGGSMLGSMKELVLGKTTPFEASLIEIRKYKQAMEDLEVTIQGIKNTYDGWDWSNLSESQAEVIRQSYRQVIETAEYSSPELKRVVADTFQDAFNIKIIPDKTEEKWIENARKAMATCTDEGTKEALRVLQIDGADKLTDAQKSLLKTLFATADDETKKQLPDLFNNAQSWINQHDLLWRIIFFTNNNLGKLSQTTQDIISSKGGTDKLSAITTDLLKEVDGEGKSIYDIRNAFQEKRQAAKNKMEAAIKGGLNETTQSYKDAKQELENVEKALTELGWTDLLTKDQKSNKGPKESQKDTIAENLKQRFKDIKDAWSEFQKWSKVEGREAAANRIGESGLFSILAKEDIPKTVEEYRALVIKLEDELKAAGIAGHSQRESLLNDILKQLLDIDKTVVDKQLKLAFDAVSKESERQLADWNLFDKIRKATGNQDLAMSIAFGLNADAETDYPTLVKNQFNEIAKAAKSALTFDTTTPEKLKDAPEEVQKAWEDATKKLEQYARQQKDSIENILSEYQSLADKLVKIDADRERKIKTVKESTMSDADKETYIRRINVEADYKKFEQSNEYLRFFNDIYGLTMSEANKIGDLIQLNLNQKLQAGLISIYDYEKEMEKVRKQLEALRNVKSNAMTLLTGGFKGLNEKKLREEEGKLANNADYQKALANQIAAQEALNKAREGGNEEEIAAAEEQLKLANESLKVYTQIRDAIIKDQEGWQRIADATSIVANIAGGMSDAFNTLRDMADSFGFDSDSNAWNTAAAMVDTLTTVTGGVQKTIQSLMSGDIGGAISGVFDTLLTPFTIWNKLHDKKLDKMIEKSKEAAQIMQNQYDILEKQMAHFFGNAAAMKTGVLGGGYGKQRELMQGQLSELEKQRQAEIDKKKTDNSVVEDYNQQIEEMKIAIRDFAIEVAQDLYGIDLNGWAEQLGDALVDAFAAGEDAAEAFDKTVGDIMRDVTSKMISQDILAPMFGDLRDYLFGSDGMSGAFGADFKLDPSEMGAMKEYLDKIKNEGIPAAQDLFDAINEATGGVLNDTEKSKSGLSAGIQSITEDTADLLASYVNAIRSSVSILEQYGMTTNEYLRTAIESSLPQLSAISESQLRMQEQIAANTLRGAIAAETIVKSNDAISRLLVKVTQGGAKFYVQ